MTRWLTSRDKKGLAWVAVVWTAFVVFVALFQDDVVRAIVLGLVQEALLLGIVLLIFYFRHRRKSSTANTPES
jgi:hypothetical protein